jgi:3-isopropylmalate/(R)-2-methylmalate dehydratase small subunit
MRRAREVSDYRLTVDLERREVRDGHGFNAAFEIDEFRRQCLLEGLDDIGLTMRHDSLIRRFEERRPAWMGSELAPAGSPEQGI